jgi:hypothetical protein
MPHASTAVVMTDAADATPFVHDSADPYLIREIFCALGVTGLNALTFCVPSKRTCNGYAGWCANGTAARPAPRSTWSQTFQNGHTIPTALVDLNPLVLPLPDAIPSVISRQVKTHTLAVGGTPFDYTEADIRRVTFALAPTVEVVAARPHLNRNPRTPGRMTGLWHVDVASSPEDLCKLLDLSQRIMLTPTHVYVFKPRLLPRLRSWYDARDAALRCAQKDNWDLREHCTIRTGLKPMTIEMGRGRNDANQRRAIVNQVPTLLPITPGSFFAELYGERELPSNDTRLPPPFPGTNPIYAPADLGHAPAAAQWMLFASNRRRINRRRCGKLPPIFF